MGVVGWGVTRPRVGRLQGVLAVGVGVRVLGDVVLELALHPPPRASQEQPGGEEPPCPVREPVCAASRGLPSFGRQRIKVSVENTPQQEGGRSLLCAHEVPTGSAAG